MEVVATGATKLRTAFDTAHNPGILLAYMSGLKIAFAIAVGGVGLALTLGMFSGWRRLDTTAAEDDEATV